MAPILGKYWRTSVDCGDAYDEVSIYAVKNRVLSAADKRNHHG